MLDSTKAAQMIAEMKKKEELDGVTKNPCKLCSMRGRKVCGCGGGSGGGSGGDAASGDDEDDKKELDSIGELDETAKIDDKNYFDMELVASSALEPGKLEFEDELEPEDKLTDQELSALLEELSGLLRIERDDDSGILKIASVRPFSSPEAQRILQYIKLIEAEFEAFKEELQESGENLSGYTATRTENSLIIRIPSKNYDLFMARLENKHLLDFSGKAAKENTMEIPEQKEGHRFSPLSTRPVPKEISSES